MTGRVIALVGQTASGKTTLARYLEQNGFGRIVTYTTRPPRKGETNGVDYRFITDEDFAIKMASMFFAEHTRYGAEFGRVRYGTSRESLETPGGVNKVIVLNPAGVMALKEAGYNIFVVYLDIDQSVLMRRALNRGDSPTEICRRITEDARLFDRLESGGFVDLRITDSNLTPRQIAERILTAL